MDLYIDFIPYKIKNITSTSLLANSYNLRNKLTVVNNDKKPLGVGEVTSDTVRNVTKDANIYKVGAEVVHIEEILVPKFDNIKGIDKTDLDTIKADTKTNRQKAYNSNVLFIVDDKTMEFYDRDKDKFEPILNGNIDYFLYLVYFFLFCFLVR